MFLNVLDRRDKDSGKGVQRKLPSLGRLGGASPPPAICSGTIEGVLALANTATQQRRERPNQSRRGRCENGASPNLGWRLPTRRRASASPGLKGVMGMADMCSSNPQTKCKQEGG